ncbi:MAG: efflux RND transporter periplasmic adaptor subunit [Thioalkalivibrio sp.]|nr:efflux RND transporter periplasmic adaptor subunit [Thioalkalivibrio sp.]
MKTGTWRALASMTALALGATACSSGEAAVEGSRLQTVQAERGDLRIRAEAIGTVEPVRTAEVKSKASGEILRLFADIGDQVAPGEMLAEIDPRDVRNQHDQAKADLDVAQARADIAQAQLERSQQLLEAGVITQREHESARLENANGNAALVKALTNFQLSELQLNDVQIRAPMAGTIIQKNIEVGTVIQSASQNVSGGSTLFTMANLAEMQVRTLIDETDVGQLQAGMGVEIMVEAFPERAFRGSLQKIEPQAVVEQNVTMFPVIVSLDNSAGLLRPGMNAEVAILIDDAIDVLLVPNNAIVQPADIGPAALALGLDIETLDMSAFMRMGRGGAGARGAGAGAAPGADAASATPQPSAEGTAAEGAPSGPAARMQELRAQVERGEISQDSMRSVMQGLRAQGGFAGPGGRGAGAAAGAAAGSTPPSQARPAAVFVATVERRWRWSAPPSSKRASRSS